MIHLSCVNQAPSVDLDGLGAELSGAEGQLLDEQSSGVAVLAKDLATVSIRGLYTQRTIEVFVIFVMPLV